MTQPPADEESWLVAIRNWMVMISCNTVKLVASEQVSCTNYISSLYYCFDHDSLHRFINFSTEHPYYSSKKTSLASQSLEIVAFNHVNEKLWHNNMGMKHITFLPHQSAKIPKCGVTSKTHRYTDFLRLSRSGREREGITTYESATLAGILSSIHRRSSS